MNVYSLRYEPIEDRLILGSSRLANGCWAYPVPTSRKDGYAIITYQGRTRPAHAVAHEVFIRTIEKGLEVDHLCRNRACVNPSHLEAVPHRINVQRSEPATREFCPRGHPLLPPGTPDRRCKKCRYAARAQWAKRNPEKEKMWRRNYRERKRLASR